MTAEKKMAGKLSERQKEGNFRILKPENNLIDFCSNDYLGLAQSESLWKIIAKNHEKVRHLNGSTGSRLLAGNTKYALELEAFLAEIFLASQTLVFQSGYAANTAVLSCIPQKGDTILYDELIHASLREGAQLSFASRFSFRHNDMNDLEKKLRTATGDIFVVSESVYSMDGDFGKLEEILKLCEKYNANLVWDEAHSTGVWGENGSGIACEKKLQDQIFARIYTFGKGMGIHGACVAGSETLINYLINYARPFIYTTAPSLHSLVSIRSAFEFLQENMILQKKLHDKISFFRDKIKYYTEIEKKSLPSESAIQILEIVGNDETRALAEHLQKSGYDIRPILSPTVKKGHERLRICLHIFNSEEEIDNLISLISSF